jgi:hypothetical protein
MYYLPSTLGKQIQILKGGILREEYYTLVGRNDLDEYVLDMDKSQKQC